MIRRTVAAFSQAVSSAAYVFIGHGRNTRVDGDFSVITIRLLSSLRALSIPKMALEKALRLAKENDAMKSKRMFVVQKQLIRNVSIFRAWIYSHRTQYAYHSLGIREGATSKRYSTVPAL